MGGPAPTVWISWKSVQNWGLYRAFLLTCQNSYGRSKEEQHNSDVHKFAILAHLFEALL